MKALFIVLNKTEKLNDLLRSFSERGIYGGTILESQGMASTLMETGEQSGIYMRLTGLLNQGRPFNRTIMMVLKDEQVPAARECVVEVLGDLNKGNTGIFFTVPLDTWEGVRFD